MTDFRLKVDQSKSKNQTQTPLQFASSKENWTQTNKIKIKNKKIKYPNRIQKNINSSKLTWNLYKEKIFLHFSKKKKINIYIWKKNSNFLHISKKIRIYLLICKNTNLITHLPYHSDFNHNQNLLKSINKPIKTQNHLWILKDRQNLQPKEKDK